MAVLAGIAALAQPKDDVVLEEAEAQQRRRRAVVHAVRGLVARAELEAAPVAEGEQEGFVDLADRAGAVADDRRVPAFELDASDRPWCRCPAWIWPMKWISPS